MSCCFLNCNFILVNMFCFILCISFSFFTIFFFTLVVLKTVEHYKYEMPYVLITLTTILSRTNFKVMYLNGKGFEKKR